MRRAMTWVYCDPKSRMRILECFGGVRSTSLRTGSVFMDAFAARHVRRLDHRAHVVPAQFGLGR